MFFCTFQEVMFVSSNILLLPPPARLSQRLPALLRVTFRSRTSFTPGPTTRPRGFDGLWTAFVLAAVCWLTVAASGCGSGVTVSASEALVRVTPGTVDFGDVGVGVSAASNVTITNPSTTSIVISQVSVSGQTFSLASGVQLPISIPAGGTHSLMVGFAPVGTDAYSGQLTMMDPSAKAIAQVPLSGRGHHRDPQLTLSASSLSFGGETVDTASTQTLTLTSSGTSAVTVSSDAISGTGFTIVGGTLPATLNPNQTLSLQVQFKPTATGAVTGQLTVSSNSTTGGTAAVALSGTGTAAASPKLTLSTSSLSFGSDSVNAAKTMSLTLTSSGTAAVTVNSGAITGTGFAIVGGTLPATLNPSQTMSLQVQFAPTATGTVTGQLTLNSNSTTGGTATVALSGTGMAPANPQLTLSASSLSFGSDTVNTAKTLSLTLASTGTSAVTVNSAAITGTGFTIVAASFPVTLNPNQSVTLQVQFDPTTTGAASGQITISSNSTTGGTAAVALSGTGTAASPQLTISASSLSFGSLTVNTASTLSLTLTSTGTSAVTVNSAAITGAGFTIVGGSFPVTLNPTQTLTLQVQFEPTTAGAVTGQLAISSNSTTGGTADVALSGTGTAVAHSVDLSWTAPSSSADPVAGYNIYRAISGGSLALVNASPDSSTTYVDSTVVSGTTYNYVVKSVDSNGAESIASNEITAPIP
jgi:Abnormal spindle-like microcephaly-assoc'd, ASPM-SPD-2-Hydin